ncbi:MAG: hypothetical protein FJX71_06300 [Alphaproteobacteria bacterium]|nr:hypothetical protein [Alphaproteobacteria bacterium]
MRILEDHKLNLIYGGLELNIITGNIEVPNGHGSPGENVVEIPMQAKKGLSKALENILALQSGEPGDQKGPAKNLLFVGFGGGGEV